MALSGDESDDYAMALVSSIASGANPHERPKVYLVHVVVLDWCLPLDADVAEHSVEAQTILDRAESIAASAGVDVETVLLQARSVGSAIVDEAEFWKADLIIMGLSADYGSVDNDYTISRAVSNVLRHAPCAVWIAREPRPEIR